MKKILFELYKKYKWTFLIEVIFLIINVYLVAIPSRIVGNMIGLLYNIDANKTAIFIEMFRLAVVCFGYIGVRVIWKNIEVKMEFSLSKDLADKLFAKLLKSKIESIEEIKNGKLMAFFVSDAKRVARISTRILSTIVRLVFNFIIIGTLMTQASNIKLAIAALVPVVITLVVIFLMRNVVSESYRKSQESFTLLSEFVQESTDSIRTMKAFAGEDVQIKEFERKNKEVRNNNLKVIKNQSLMDILISLGFGVSYAITLLWGSSLVIKGEMSVGDLVAFTGYLGVLGMPVYWFPWLLTRFKKIRVSSERLSELINLPEEDVEVLDEKIYENLNGNIQIKNLTYNYPGYIERVLENITVNIKQGESLGIIGVVGSGKTTLMNLLLKLYDVERGKIFIDGVDINDIPTKKIRDNICYITQDNFLFSASLKENINLFKDEYKDSEIEESTKMAMIYEEISEMQEGIHTIIGEKGIDLSGGQKQRVVISRAFLNNSNIVIFDDTFSALDNRTEQHVLKNIKKLTKDKTCIIISNRISDIRDCDKIIVMEQGAIVEQGNHESLLKNHHKYYEFFESQAHKTDFAVLE
ncbi:MAG: ABC transporter ATP-binding protein [Clostridia bacterium]|nr:ABC transporter ATP-binding protein [Clostridia bacterium]